MWRSIVFVLTMASLTAGCAFGRKQEFESARLDVGTTGKSICVGVLDHRPYVLDKSKSQSFVGLSRSGLAIPYDIRTGSSRPLADDMALSLANSLRAKGATVSVVTLAPPTGDSEALAEVAKPGSKGLLIVLKEWKSDTYVNTDLSFDVRAVVVDAQGRALGENHISGTEGLPYEGLNSRETAPITAFGKKMQQLLAVPAIANQL